MKEQAPCITEHRGGMSWDSTLLLKEEHDLKDLTSYMSPFSQMFHFLPMVLLGDKAMPQTT